MRNFLITNTNMLQEFSVGNYLSFKDAVKLDLSTAGITEYPENAFEAGKKKLLKGAVVYRVPIRAGKPTCCEYVENEAFCTELLEGIFAG
ncbi:MAG: hypothetical protein H6573_01640 [Lewinellaceae bacterium]|nr:hypothetical protein [Lewinellaceae bacterium]